jgi:acyl dehydratase
MINPIPQTGFLRLSQILGNKKSAPPTPPIIPIGKTAWYAGIKTGRFPRPVRIGPHAMGWRAEDIRDLIERISAEA